MHFISNGGIYLKLYEIARPIYKLANIIFSTTFFRYFLGYRCKKLFFGKHTGIVSFDHWI